MRYVWPLFLALMLVLLSNAHAASKTHVLRYQARHWEQIIGTVGRAHTRFSGPRARRFWSRRARAVQRVAKQPPHKSGWLCIHGYDGSWRDSGDPYWGGLQFDRSFMYTYAPRVLLRKGFANAWSPLETMWVAERAYRSGRGYWPWPNTARFCGLIG